MKWIRWRRSARAAGPASGGEVPVDPPFAAAEAIDARLSRALDGDLTAAEAAALRAQLDADPELRARMDGLAAVRTALAALGAEDELRAPRSFALSPEQAEREWGASNRAPTARAPGAAPRVSWLEWATRGGAVAAAALFAAVLLTDAGDTPTDEPQPEAATAALAPQAERTDLFADDRAADTETVPESGGASEVGGAAAPAPDTSDVDAAADAAADAESVVDDDAPLPVPLPAPSVAPEPAVSAEAEQGGDDEAAADGAEADRAEADGAQADGAEELAAELAPEASEDDGIGRPVLLGSLAALAVALAALAVALGRLRAREPSSLDRR